jgi:hypothetical protein
MSEKTKKNLEDELKNLILEKEEKKKYHSSKFQELESLVK